MSGVATMPDVRGKLTRSAPLAPLVWFKSGGEAEWLFEPADADDLAQFLAELDPSIAILPLGLGSNLIIRDGGVPGVVVRLGKSFSWVDVQAAQNGAYLACGAGTPGILVASTARDTGAAGLEFLRGIPGTVGGAVRMNAGAYGRETEEILVDATVVLRSGEVRTVDVGAMGCSYRHSDLPADAIVIAATFYGEKGDPQAIGAEMDAIARAREESQPLRTRTGGSTFKNPPGHKAWALIDAAGCRGLTHGNAQVSEKHCNFLLNLGNATSSDIEELGEEVRRRVMAKCNIALEWEIQRVGSA